MADAKTMIEAIHRSDLPRPPFRAGLAALGRLRHDRRYPPNLARHGLWPTNPYVLLAPPGPAFESFNRMTELPRARAKQRGRRSASIFDWTRAT
jgi:hypothetical protein